MSLSAAVVRELVRAGLDGEALIAACERIECADKPVRTANAERQARFRARQKADESVTSVTRNVTVTQKEGFPPDPLSKKNTSPPSPPKGGHSPHGFFEFWQEYPHKVGKRDAEKAFAKASTRTDIPSLMAGLRRYVAKTDDRPWCNPATWLNQDRWADQPATAPPRQSHLPPRQNSFSEHLIRKAGLANEPDYDSTRHDNASFGSADRAGFGAVIDLVAVPGKR